jgi:hypothetical protein
MQIPIKIPTGSIQEIVYFTFSYIHGSWLFILWFHCGFCNKKGTFRVFTGFGHLQTSETSGRNMTVELDRRHPLLPKAGWGKWRFDSDLKKKKMETFVDTSAFNAGVKEKNTKTNKLQLLKIKNLQHKTSFLTCIYIFPLVTYKDFPFYGKYA